MAEKKNNGLGLPQTKGNFQLRGLVVGTESDKFYKDFLTKESRKPWRTLNFGVKTKPDSTTYLTMSTGEKENVYFCKTTTVDGKKKTETEKVAWRDRFTFNREGYKLIGINVGLEKTTDDKGKEVNDRKILSEFDASQYMSEHLKDNQSVYVKGDIEYSHFTSDGKIKRSMKFIPKQTSLCKEVDFEDEKFEEVADFTQIIVFDSIRQHNEDKSKFIVNAKIVNYNSIENAEFTIVDKNLANLFRKNLKPYTAIKVWGKISVEQDTSEVDVVDDGWGESNKMEKVNSPVIRDLIIIGANPQTIDTDTYSESKINEALEMIKANERANKEFGDDTSDNSISDEWGSVNTTVDTSDETGW